MTVDQIQQCKDKLLLIRAKYKELEASLAEDEALGDSSEKPMQNSIGRQSLMETMQAQTELLNKSRELEMMADNIEGGLRRVENEGYGKCFYCEEAIDFKRLIANPTHTRCIKCVDNP